MRFDLLWALSATSCLLFIVLYGNLLPLLFQLLLDFLLPLQILFELLVIFNDAILEDGLRVNTSLSRHTLAVFDVDMVG